MCSTVYLRTLHVIEERWHQAVTYLLPSKTGVLSIRQSINQSFSGSKHVHTSAHDIIQRRQSPAVFDDVIVTSRDIRTDRKNLRTTNGFSCQSFFHLCSSDLASYQAYSGLLLDRVFCIKFLFGTICLSSSVTRVLWLNDTYYLKMYEQVNGISQWLHFGTKSSSLRFLCLPNKGIGSPLMI